MEVEADERDRQRELEEIEEIRKRIVVQSEDMDEQVSNNQYLINIKIDTPLLYGLVIIYLTTRFHVAVRLFSNRSQMTSKSDNGCLSFLNTLMMDPSRVSSWARVCESCMERLNLISSRCDMHNLLQGVYCFTVSTCKTG